jgi:hypothetical protein
MWVLWWTQWLWGKFFSPSTSGSPANLYFTDCSTIIIYHLGLVQTVAAIPSGLSLTAWKNIIGFEVLTAVVMRTVIALSPPATEETFFFLNFGL